MSAMASPLTDKREPNERSALFTVLLTACVAVILAVVFTAVAYFMTGQLASSQPDLAAHQVRVTLTNACNVYKLKNGDWPDTLQALLGKGERGGPYLDNAETLCDPWGNAYHYDFHGPENDGAKPDIWAINPINGTKIGNWPANH
jgi:type II secretory pathway pseudopilin PulG